jgi:hypothetical protein
MKKYKILLDKNTYKDSEIIEVIKISFDKFGLDKNKIYFAEDKPSIDAFIPLSIK